LVIVLEMGEKYSAKQVMPDSQFILSPWKCLLLLRDPLDIMLGKGGPDRTPIKDSWSYNDLVLGLIWLAIYLWMFLPFMLMISICIWFPFKIAAICGWKYAKAVTGEVMEID
jgi:hypothetical protein